MTKPPPGGGDQDRNRASTPPDESVEAHDRTLPPHLEHTADDPSRADDAVVDEPDEKPARTGQESEPDASTAEPSAFAEDGSGNGPERHETQGSPKERANDARALSDGGHHGTSQGSGPESVTGSSDDHQEGPTSMNRQAGTGDVTRIGRAATENLEGVTGSSSPEPLNLVTEPIKTPDADPATSTLAVAPGPGAPADRRHEVARWIVSWSEPLLDETARVKIATDMGHFIDRNSEWSVAFLAGVLTDLAQSLPTNDPWRHMAGLIDLRQVATGIPAEDKNMRLARRSERAPLPGLTGAITVEGRPFGTRRDAADLIAPGASDVSTDLSMAAVAVNLSPLAAALVAFASHDPKTVQVVLGQTLHHLWMANVGSVMPQTAGQAMFEAASSAIRWLIHRRRAYTGIDDTFPNIVGLSWIAKADRVNAGGNIAVEGGLGRQGAIDPAEYRFLSGADDDF